MDSIQQSLEPLLMLDGVFGAAVGDWKTGMSLGVVGGTPEYPFERLELAVAANSTVIKAKLRAIEILELKQEVEDILITLDSQYHLMRLTRSLRGLFIYLALDRQKANLALARFKLSDVESKLVL